MSSDSTLVLTQGTHLIDDESAIAVEKALELGAHSVDVDIDLTGSGNVVSRARISMAHVVAVIRHQAVPSLQVPTDSNVYALRVR